jgi:exosortase
VTSLPLSSGNPSAALPASQAQGTRAPVFVGSARRQAWLTAAGLGLALLWCYWPTLEAMAERWARDAQYSHGFLVPVFALFVLWVRRPLLRGVQARPHWWGLPLLLAGVSLRLAAASMDIAPLDPFSLLPTLAGLVLLVGGVGVFRWAWPAIAFLGFMLPLPFQVEAALAQPLRRVATVASTYALQTFGLPALSEGNIILLDQARLGVIDACNGLGMLVTFFALATAMALVVRAPLADKLVIIVSAIPIALVVNIVRITATGVAHYTVGSGFANLIMHDLAGWLMMPLALVLLWLELRFLGRLLVIKEARRPLSVVRVRPAASIGLRTQGNKMTQETSPWPPLVSSLSVPPPSEHASVPAKERG